MDKTTQTNWKVKYCSNCEPKPNKMINAYFLDGLTNCTDCGRLLYSIKSTKEETKQSILKAIMDKLRKLSHEVDKRGYDWRHDAVVRATLSEFESVIKEILK